MLYPWNIIGSKGALRELEQDLAKENVHHAYLFTGAPATGKWTAAKTFAGILQCPRGYCRTCVTCKNLTAGTHADTLVFADNGESLGIETVRDITAKASIKAEGMRRLILIENAERMGNEAQNALLKTLEEPPGRTAFVLTTSRLDTLLPTLRSRTREVHFGGAGEKELRNHLEYHFAQQTGLEEAIAIAQGRPGIALKLMKEPEYFKTQKELYASLETFLQKNDAGAKFRLVEALDKTPERLEEFFDLFAGILRQHCLESMRRETSPSGPRLGLHELVKLFESLEKTRYLIEGNVNRKLALEALLLQTET